MSYEAIASVHEVYTLLVPREFGPGLKAVELARSAIPTAEPSARLALYEAIVHVLDEFVTELGEHGLQNQALWGVELADVDVPNMVAECATAWREVTRLAVQHRGDPTWAVRVSERLRA